MASTRSPASDHGSATGGGGYETRLPGIGRRPDWLSPKKVKVLRRGYRCAPGVASASMVGQRSVTGGCLLALGFRRDRGQWNQAAGQKHRWSDPSQSGLPRARSGCRRGVRTVKQCELPLAQNDHAPRSHPIFRHAVRSARTCDLRCQHAYAWVLDHVTHDRARSNGVA